MLLTIRGNGILVSLSGKNRRHNGNEKSSKEEALEVSFGKKSRVHRSIETTNSSSSNCVGYESCRHIY